MRELYIEGVAIHGGPDHARALVRVSAKRWYRGCAGWAIEPRNAGGSGCRRCRNERKATSPMALSRAVGGPREVREPVHARKSPCARTGRSDDRPAGGDGRQWGREGKAKVVIP